MPSEDLVRAATLLAAGDWQGDPTPIGAWLHGIVHLLEGDPDNARYWYRQAGRPFPRADQVDAEVDAVQEAVARGSLVTRPQGA